MKGQFLHIKLLAQRLSIILLLYTLCRVLFYLFNIALFPSVDFTRFLSILFFGLPFDISAIIYTNLLFIALHIIPFPQRNTSWYQRLLKIVFYIPNTVALFLSVADFEYFRFSLKRSSADVTGFYTDFLNLFPQFLKDFWYQFVIFMGLLLLAEFLYRKTAISEKISTPINYPVQLLSMVVVSGLVIIGARGGIQQRPITPITALQYVDATNAPLVTNTPFQFYYSFGQEELPKVKYFSEEELKNEFQFCRENNTSAPTIIPLPPPEQKDNILIIIMESFSQEYMGLYGADKSYTPFLDSLGKAGLVYKNMFANGTRSVEGIPAVCASIPSLMDESFIYSFYQTNKIDGIGTLLKKTGYTSSFFHGGNNGTFNFDSFSRLAGFENYYGRKEYHNEKDYDGNWGIFDEPFFQFTAKKINEMKEPFCTVLFSLSSHHPYTIPEKYEQKFQSVDDPFLRSVRYADYSLEQFFKTASKMPWFDHTLFIITADHKGPSYGEYANTWIGRYSIPLIVFKPGSEIKGEYDFPVQQADITPGILDYTNYPYPFCSFGESIFRNTPHQYVYQYMSGTSQIIDGKYVLHFDGRQTIALYEYHKYQHLEPDIKGNLPEEQKRLQDRLKAVLQYYRLGMINNGLSANQ